MNIFVLDLNLERCAFYMVDCHVVKMITEYAQMLSTAVRMSGLNAGYKITHVNHPCNIWTRQSLDNFLWLKKLSFYVNEEWKRRFNHIKNHKAFDMIQTLPIPNLPEIPRTPFVLAMPEYCKMNDPVQSYRNYYIQEKQHIATWKHNAVPEWFIFK